MVPWGMGSSATPAAADPAVAKIPSGEVKVTHTVVTVETETTKAKEHPPTDRKDSKDSDASEEGLSEFPHLTSLEVSQTDRETILKNMNRDRSDGVKQGLLDVRPEPKSGISGWSTKGFLESAIPDCPAGMEAIIPLQRVFAEVAGQEFDSVFPAGVKNKYEILSESKQRLYFAAETLEENDSFPFKVREVDFTVLGPMGGLVFHLAGTTENCTVQNELTTFGSIQRVGFMSSARAAGKSSKYAVYDEAGLELYRLIPSVGKGFKQVQYAIYPPGGPQGGRVKEIGTMKRNWDDRLEQPEQFGVMFPTNCSPTKKTLLLAAMLIRYFRLEEPTNYGENRRRFFHGLWYSLVVGLMILGLFLAIILVAILVKPNAIEEMVVNTQLCKDSEFD